MGWFGIGGTAKNFTPTKYEGRRAPSVDFSDSGAGQYMSQSFPESLKALVTGNNTGQANSFRPVQSLYTGIVANRAQGNDVGYSPEWLKSSQSLINSELGKAQEDRLRDTRGSLSASGLSGNPRAYEATAGRVQRDTQRELQDAMSKLTISDMERKNQERDVNTGRLGALNTQNFNQENQAANFDEGLWTDENRFGLSAAQLAADNFWKQQSQNEAAIQDIGTGIGGIAGMQSSPSAISLAQPTGQGIAPAAGSSGYTPLSAQSLGLKRNKYLMA